MHGGVRSKGEHIVHSAPSDARWASVSIFPSALTPVLVKQILRARPTTPRSDKRLINSTKFQLINGMERTILDAHPLLHDKTQEDLLCLYVGVVKCDYIIVGGFMKVTVLHSLPDGVLNSFLFQT